MNHEHIDISDLVVEIGMILTPAVGREYAWIISNRDEFCESVRQNIEETSAWQDEGYYNDDDIRLAIGRVIMSQFGIEY